MNRNMKKHVNNDIGKDVTIDMKKNINNDIEKDMSIDIKKSKNKDTRKNMDKEEEKETKKDNKEDGKEINKLLIIAIIPVFLNQLLSYGICNLRLSYLYMPALFFSAAIMYGIYFLITAIVKKTHIATYIIAIIIFIISIISNIKLYYTDSPIYLSDIYFLNNIGEVTGLVKGDVLQHIDYVQHLILLVLLIGICIISKKYSYEIKTNKNRIIIGVSIIVAFAIIFVPIKPKDTFILNTIYDVDGRKDYEATTTGLDYYIKYGVLAGMYGMELENRSTPPDGYNEDVVKQELEKASEIDQETKDLQKPNIIVMFQESYWDIEKIEEVEFDKDVTENMDNLKKEGTSVNLLSSSYGGLSSNIEFELLTGGNLAYFGTGYHPFIQLYSRKESEDNPSIIKELKNNGYKTKMVFGRDYYASENVYKKLGIDQYVNEYQSMADYDQKIKGTHLSDEALVDNVIETLKNKSPEDRIFYMTATIETHMPFNKEKYDNYINVTSSSLTEEETGVILSYAQGIYDTNVQIKRLYEEIQKLEEPTIIVVLGDHLPYLYNSKGEDILQKLSYFNTDDEKTNLLRKYTTEGIILSNYDKKVDLDNEYISPDMLLTSIINQMDIKISPYYKWLYSIKDKLPAQNQYISLDNDGNIYYINETLPAEIEEIKDIREEMQYYLFERRKKCQIGQMNKSKQYMKKEKTY